MITSTQRHSFRQERWRSLAKIAAVMLFVLHTASVARADDWRLAIGPFVGAVVFDQSLSNYRWDTRPAIQTGLQTTLYRGRVGAGIRLWRTHTTQSTGIPGTTDAPRVNLTGVDVVGAVRALSYRGVELWGSGHGGLLHLGYDPDQLTVNTGGIPITVDYKPITEWDFGVGIEIRREMTRQMALSLQGDWSSFALDTARRVGAQIVESRERFYGWSLRLQASWLMDLN